MMDESAFLDSREEAEENEHFFKDPLPYTSLLHRLATSISEGPSLRLPTKSSSSSHSAHHTLSQASVDNAGGSREQQLWQEASLTPESATAKTTLPAEQLYGELAHLRSLLDGALDAAFLQEEQEIEEQRAEEAETPTSPPLSPDGSSLQLSWRMDAAAASKRAAIRSFHRLLDEDALQHLESRLAALKLFSDYYHFLTEQMFPAAAGGAAASTAAMSQSSVDRLPLLKDGLSSTVAMLLQNADTEPPLLLRDSVTDRVVGKLGLRASQQRRLQVDHRGLLAASSLNSGGRGAAPLPSLSAQALQAGTFSGLTLVNMQPVPAAVQQGEDFAGSSFTTPALQSQAGMDAGRSVPALRAHLQQAISSLDRTLDAVAIAEEVLSWNNIPLTELVALPLALRISSHPAFAKLSFIGQGSNVAVQLAANSSAVVASMPAAVQQALQPLLPPGGAASSAPGAVLQPWRNFRVYTGFSNGRYGPHIELQTTVFLELRALKSAAGITLSAKKPSSSSSSSDSSTATATATATVQDGQLLGILACTLTTDAVMLPWQDMQQGAAQAARDTFPTLRPAVGTGMEGQEEGGAAGTGLAKGLPAGKARLAAASSASFQQHVLGSISASSTASAAQALEGKGSQVEPLASWLDVCMLACPLEEQLGKAAELEEAASSSSTAAQGKSKDSLQALQEQRRQRLAQRKKQAAGAGTGLSGPATGSDAADASASAAGAEGDDTLPAGEELSLGSRMLLWKGGLPRLQQQLKDSSLFFLRPSLLDSSEFLEDSLRSAAEMPEEMVEQLLQLQQEQDETQAVTAEGREGPSEQLQASSSSSSSSKRQAKKQQRKQERQRVLLAVQQAAASQELSEYELVQALDELCGQPLLPYLQQAKAEVLAEQQEQSVLSSRAAAFAAGNSTASNVFRQLPFVGRFLDSNNTAGSAGAAGTASAGGAAGGTGVSAGTAGPSPSPSPLPDVLQVEVELNTVALPTLCTQLWSWGRGEFGVLGIGSSTSSGGGSGSGSGSGAAGVFDSSRSEGAAVSSALALAGQSGGDVPFPVPVSLPREVGTWRIKAVACSWHHSVALADSGLLFTWGSGADGALGHGNTVSHTRPRLVEFFGLMNPLTVTAIAAGSDLSGSHTVIVATGKLAEEQEEEQAAGREGAAGAAAGAAAGGGGSRNARREAIATLSGPAAGKSALQLETGLLVAPAGRVFAWGKGTAVGNGAAEEASEPQLVKPDPGSCDMYALAHGGVVTVAAGGGFSVAITRSGAAYSWGKWANGRLGLGPASAYAVASNGDRRAPPRFALSPVRITRGLAWPRRVAAGGAAAAAKAAAAAEKAGKGKAGKGKERAGGVSNASSAAEVAAEEEEQEEELLEQELLQEAVAQGSSSAAASSSFAGIGSSSPPSNSSTPPSLSMLACPNLFGRETIPLRTIACGEAHALAIDAFGLLWSWGRGTGGQLGIGTDADALAPLRVRVYERPQQDASGFAQQEEQEEEEQKQGGQGKATSQHRLEPVRFVRTGCGVSHSLAISTAGHLYSWGGFGGNMLGHGDHPLKAAMRDMPASWLRKLKAMEEEEAEMAARAAAGGGGEAAGVEGQSLAAPGLTTAGTLMGWKKPWFYPRRVRVFDGSSQDLQIIAASGGAYHSLALSSSGHLYVFGDNSHGVLGMGWSDNNTQEQHNCVLVPAIVSPSPFAGVVRGSGWLGARPGGWQTAGKTIHALAAASVTAASATGSSLASSLGSRLKSGWKRLTGAPEVAGATTATTPASSITPADLPGQTEEERSIALELQQQRRQQEETSALLSAAQKSSLLPRFFGDKVIAMACGGWHCLAVRSSESAAGDLAALLPVSTLALMEESYRQKLLQAQEKKGTAAARRASLLASQLASASASAAASRRGSVTAGDGGMESAELSRPDLSAAAGALLAPAEGDSKGGAAGKGSHKKPKRGGPASVISEGGSSVSSFGGLSHALSMYARGTGAAAAGAMGSSAAAVAALTGSAAAGEAICPYDMSLSVEGRLLPAHRAILSCRSPLLHRKIREAAIPGRRLVLQCTDLALDVAVLLLEFLYTDDIAAPPAAMSALMRELLETAVTYQLPRLEAICRLQLDSPALHWVRQLADLQTEGAEGTVAQQQAASQQLPDALVAPDEGSGGGGSGESAGGGRAGSGRGGSRRGGSSSSSGSAGDGLALGAMALQNRENLLGTCLLQLLLQPEWHDIVFVCSSSVLAGAGTAGTAGGGSKKASSPSPSPTSFRLPAHSCILFSRCRFFQVLLRDAVSEAERLNRGIASGPAAEVELPDSPMTFLRLLYFLYSGSLAPLPASAEEVEESGELIPGFPFSFLPEPVGVLEEVDEEEEEEEEEDEEEEGEGEKDGASVKGAAGASSSSSAPAPKEAGSSPPPSIPSHPLVLLPPSWTPEQQLLADLIAADKYGIEEAKTALQSALQQLQPTQVPQVLELCDLIPAPRLREAATVSALSDLAAVTASPGFQLLGQRSSHLAQELLQRVIKRDRAFLGLLPLLDPSKQDAAEGIEELSWEEAEAAKAARAAALEAQRQAEKSKADRKQLLSIAGLTAVIIALALAFRIMSVYNTSVGSAVPAANLAFLVVLLGAAYYGLLTL